KLAGALAENGNGKNHFEDHAETPRHTFAADPRASAEWTRTYLKILDTRDSKSSLEDEQNMNWRQILIDELKHRTHEDMKATVEAEMNIIQRYSRRISEMVSKHATVSRLIALGAAFAGA